MGKVESISLNVNPEATPAILVKSGYHGPSGTFPNILKRPTGAAPALWSVFFRLFKSFITIYTSIFDQKFFFV